MAERGYGMWRAAIFSSAAVAVLISATPVSADPVTDRWALDVSLGKCRLDRIYSQPESAAITLETEPGTDDYTLIVYNKRPTRLSSGSTDGVLKIDGKTQAKNYLNIGTGGSLFPVQLTMGGLKGASIDAIGAGAKLSIMVASRDVASLPLTDVRQAVGALRKCEAEQLTEWGADPAQFAPGGSAPKVGDRYKLVSQAVLGTVHYPKGAIEALHYVVLSDAGVVERCAAVFGIPDSDLEQIVCKSLMGRKIGDPARDASGKAVRSVVAFTPARIRREYF
jgi:hypothetical protein